MKTSGQVLGILEALRAQLQRLSKTYDEARFFRDGLAVAIVGRPNVGKSSLLNILLARERAIVTEIPGTTRDLIEEHLDLEGLPVRIIDTAGIRHSDERIEREGIQRSLRAIEDSDCILAVFDSSVPLNGEDRDLLDRIRGRNAILVFNKTDLPCEPFPEDLSRSEMPRVRISTRTGEGLDQLKSLIVSTNLRNWRREREGVVVTNLRQKHAIDRTSEAIGRSSDALRADLPLEIVSLELRDGLAAISELTGAVTTETILDRIFSEFCIGK